MNNQSTHTILMIEPVAFGFNAETAVNNYFQQNETDKTNFSYVTNCLRLIAGTSN